MKNRTPARILLATLIWVLLGLAGVSPAVAQPTDTPIPLSPPIRMLGLGDSYQSGVGDDHGLMPTGSYEPGTVTVGEGGNGCFRSLSDIPRRVAPKIGATSLDDVTCVGADASHFNTAQYPGQPAQLDAVRPWHNLITVGMGGNPWFSPVINQMVKLYVFGGQQAIGAGDPVYDAAWNYYANDLKAELVAANRKIYSLAAPDAVIYQSNYPPILPTTEQGIGTCGQFASPESIPALQRLLDRLNQTVAEAASESGAVLVDLTAPDSEWRKHGRVDACSPTNPGAWNLRLRVPLDFSKLTSFDDVLAATQYGSFHATPDGNNMTATEVVKTVKRAQR